MAEPPVDLPPPSAQDSATASASFEPSPTGSTLCGFGIPGFAFSLDLIGFEFDLDFPPQLNFGIALNCSLSDPFEVEFGGGRASNYDPDVEDE